jgi:hypothetical protein
MIVTDPTIPFGDHGAPLSRDYARGMWLAHGRLAAE